MTFIFSNIPFIAMKKTVFGHGSYCHILCIYQWSLLIVLRFITFITISLSFSWSKCIFASSIDILLYTCAYNFLDISCPFPFLFILLRILYLHLIFQSLRICVPVWFFFFVSFMYLFSLSLSVAIFLFEFHCPLSKAVLCSIV